jgi:formylglycine-generating enzyme required for sulfatase activity
MQKIGAYYQGEVMTNSLGMQLVWIPPGQFLMGKKGRPFRVPQHRVRISRGFWMGVYEVTQTQYEAAMGKNPSYPKGNALPVDHVSWHDATEFCQKLSHKEGRTYRLPMEAEWEYACRAGTQTDYWWGDTPEADPNKANGFGLFNMHDGVAEWCQDWYSDGYYVIAPQMDPQGPRQPQVEPQAPKPQAELQSLMQPQRPRGRRVTRGNPRSDALGEGWPCFARGQQPPEETSRRLGFRVVLADDWSCGEEGEVRL